MQGTSTQKDYSEANAMTERFIQEYENSHKKSEDKIVGGIVIGFKMPDGSNEYRFFPRNVSALTLGELRIERDTGIPVGKDLFYVARFNKRGKNIKPEEIDLSKINVEEIIVEEMKSLRNLE